jgi:hypothetical protein
MNSGTVTVTHLVWLTVTYADGTRRIEPASGHRDARAALLRLITQHGWILNGNGRSGTLLRRRGTHSRIAATYTISERDTHDAIPDR